MRSTKHKGASDIAELFGCRVFGDAAMRAKLPDDVYQALKRTMRSGRSLDPQIAGVIANAMKDWAIDNGATHFSHWFQPMTGVTAEKHESFLYPTSYGGVLMEFSGKELIRGEPDASSFPSGGLRATFEARGYTAWDPTSYAFIKEDTLCIPTAFCSYAGDSLDKKTPLMRSMEALGKQALRVLRALGDNETKNVIPMVGAEQEYFLIDRKLYEARRDLFFTGRTLFGARPPKGQELDDHFFGSIKTRVSAFMKDLDRELWRLGVPAKTEHNETAPAQHELAIVYSTANIATDHNQLVMEMLKKVAERHQLACLLHEKPFSGINGSGKHNNWSLATDRGENLLDPGKVPAENTRFLTFLCATMQAVDEYQDLLRASVATPSNDCRFGGFEAPPTIVSMFLGDELTGVLDAIEHGDAYGGSRRGELRTGVHVLPHLQQDTTDRNRTSPFAYTGNKFEFRMPGSSQSVADPNTVLNTIVADALRAFADELEASEDPSATLPELLKRTIREHRRIIFNGNNYTPEWEAEAARRGLSNLRSTVDALPCLVSDKNLAVFTRHRVLTEAENRSRYEILVRHYAKVLHIEAVVMLDMARQDMLPAVIACQREIGETILAKRAVAENLPCAQEMETLETLAKGGEALHRGTQALEAALDAAEGIADGYARAVAYRDEILPLMAKLREAADGIELRLPTKYRAHPTYADMLFSL